MPLHNCFKIWNPKPFSKIDLRRATIDWHRVQYRFYICIKILVVVLLVVTVALSSFKKDSANYILQYISTLTIQFVPLAIRYLSVVENGFLVSIIITFVFFLIYAGVVLGLSVLSKKTIVAAKQLEGKTIPVNEETKDEQNG